MGSLVTSCSWDHPCELGQELQFAPTLHLWANGQIGPWNIPEGSVTFRFTYHEQPTLGINSRISMTALFEGRYTVDGPVVVRVAIAGEGFAWTGAIPLLQCDAEGNCTPTDQYRVVYAGFSFGE